MSRTPHAAQIDLTFSDLTRELLDFRSGIGPAISRASASTSSDTAGLEQAGRLNPWRRAFLATRARPRAVCGPVLARAFARFALIFRSLVKLRFLLWLGGLDYFKLGVLDFLHAPSQRCAEDRPMAFDLGQARIAAVLGDAG